MLHLVFSSRSCTYYNYVHDPDSLTVSQWLSNLFLRENHLKIVDGSVDIKIVDLQTLQGVSPIVDLLYFIFTGSDEEFRGKYYKKLLDHYCTELHAAMTRLHLKPEDVYSREDFEYELEKKQPLGLALAVFALPLVTVETEHAPKVNEDLDLSSFTIQKTSDMYAERLNGVVNDYVTFGVLK